MLQVLFLLISCAGIFRTLLTCYNTFLDANILKTFVARCLQYLCFCNLFIYVFNASFTTAFLNYSVKFFDTQITLSLNVTSVQFAKSQLNSNQIFHYTRCITPKRVTSWQGPSPRRCAWTTHLLSKKCCCGGEPLATLCLIWLAQNFEPQISSTRDEGVTAWPTVWSQLNYSYYS